MSKYPMSALSLHRLIPAILSCLLASQMPSVYANNDDLMILSTRGKPGRGLLELIGDAKGGEWARPAVDHHINDAIILASVKGVQKTDRARYIEFTGDHCGDFCLSQYSIKSSRGSLNLTGYRELVFDILVIESPIETLKLRIGGWPARAELDINDLLPDPEDGWKEIRIKLSQFDAAAVEGYTSTRVADPFNLNSTGTMKIQLNNVRWIKD